MALFPFVGGSYDVRSPSFDAQRTINLYPEGSHLKDRAYNIFYMGINVGACLAPITMEIVKSRFGFHPAFAVAAFGMVISVVILWRFKRHVEEADRLRILRAKDAANIAAVTTDLPPASVSRQLPIDAVPDWKRVTALLVIFFIVIVFWMVFHQNGSTITYWANENASDPPNLWPRANPMGSTSKSRATVQRWSVTSGSKSSASPDRTDMTICAVKSLPLFQMPPPKQLGNLHRVQRRTFAQVIGHAPQV